MDCLLYCSVVQCSVVEHCPSLMLHYLGALLKVTTTFKITTKWSALLRHINHITKERKTSCILNCPLHKHIYISKMIQQVQLNLPLANSSSKVLHFCPNLKLLFPLIQKLIQHGLAKHKVWFFLFTIRFGCALQFTLFFMMMRSCYVTEKINYCFELYTTF